MREVEKGTEEEEEKEVSESHAGELQEEQERKHRLTAPTRTSRQCVLFSFAMDVNGPRKL